MFSLFVWYLCEYGLLCTIPYLKAIQIDIRTKKLQFERPREKSSPIKNDIWFLRFKDNSLVHFNSSFGRFFRNQEKYCSSFCSLSHSLSGFSVRSKKNTIGKTKHFNYKWSKCKYVRLRHAFSVFFISPFTRLWSTYVCVHS